MLIPRFTFNENGFYKTVQRRGAAILKKVVNVLNISIITIITIITIVITITIIATIITIVIKVGTGPTLASKLTMDFLAWAFIASLVVLAAQPSVMVMIMMIMIDDALDAY